MYAHGYRDPVTGKFWNSTTHKFVVRLRTSQKGKSKGIVYTQRAKALNIPAGNAWLPNKLTREDLRLVFDTIWQHKEDWEMDKVLATINTIYFNRYCRGYKNGWLISDGYLYIPNKQFRRWVHDKFHWKYMDVLVEANIILKVAFDYSKYDPSKPKYAYKINSDLVDKSYSQWYNVGYCTDRMHIKIHEQKEQRVKNIDASNTRRVMALWCKELVKEIDYDALLKDLEAKVKRSRKSDPWNTLKIKKNSYHDLLEITRGLVSGEVFYCNAKDETGHRFHSPFTNTNDFIMNYARIDGERVVQNDIKNSQMYFFSLCLSNTDSIYNLLQDDDPDGRFWKALQYIQRFKGNSDLIEFSNLSKTGDVYDKLAVRLSIRRKAAKDKLIKVLFSNKTECLSARAKINAFYPTLVHLANVLNEHSLIPIMMQRAESKVLELVCTELIEANIKLFTCHDSITTIAGNAAFVNQTMKKVFNRLNLPEPVIQMKERC